MSCYALRGDLWTRESSASNSVSHRHQSERKWSKATAQITLWFSYGFPMVFLWFSYGFTPYWHSSLTLQRDPHWGIRTPTSNMQPDMVTSSSTLFVKVTWFSMEPRSEESWDPKSVAQERSKLSEDGWRWSPNLWDFMGFGVRILFGPSEENMFGFLHDRHPPGLSRLTAGVAAGFDVLKARPGISAAPKYAQGGIHPIINLACGDDIYYLHLFTNHLWQYEG